ncbi:flavin monoamine oxidase family protein [Halioxenophilus sp. WMMB6]|uniref:flavin monoamine oxidase family protein n=1 Tax=Halioxenophilus sp. WMMB6 TaxID=3073815 RepID=UPI00295E3D67|nr:FAD-dependent oxidoreductase [Halioxenophilus sp. WMMB6]
MKKISRRQFLAQVAMAGGTLAVYNTAMALDLVGNKDALTTLKLKPTTSKQTVAVLGGGIAGLAAAHELGEAGYNVVILEASHRLGGRNLTLRHGDLIDELGRPNYCQFDKAPNLYFNAGPARIPGHHRRLLHYCKKFHVPLAIKANHNRLAYAYDNVPGAPAMTRQQYYISDARGFLAELAWKAVKKNLFDEPLSKEDVEKLEFFIRGYGDLDTSGQYSGTYRAGATTDRMLSHGDKYEPMALQQLVNSEYWKGSMNSPENFDWLSPLMEPKGGMDQVVEGFKRNLKAKVKLKAQVQAINLRDDGVEIAYQYKGKVETLKADYCFNNIPAPFLPGIPNNFSEGYRDVIASFERDSLFKIGFQMKKRFWEEEGIYGGITYTSDRINQIWYPGHDINADKGVLLGAYIWNPEDIEHFANLSLEDRLKEAAAQGEAIHKGYSGYIENGVSIAWHRMNNMMGCGNRISESHFERNFPLAQKPEGNRHFLIGDQVSYHPGWQEGALASAETALLQFNQLVSAA